MYQIEMSSEVMATILSLFNEVAMPYKISAPIIESFVAQKQAQDQALKDAVNGNG